MCISEKRIIKKCTNKILLDKPLNFELKTLLVNTIKNKFPIFYKKIRMLFLYNIMI